MEILIIIIASISIVNAVFIWQIYRMVTHKFVEYDQKFGELNIENELQIAFSEKSENDDEFNSVVNELFERVKLKYNFAKVSSYADLILKINHSSKIDSSLKHVLVDFFERVVILSYTHDHMTEEEKSELRKELKIILKKFQENKKRK